MQHRDELVALTNYLACYTERKPADHYFSMRYWHTPITSVDPDEVKHLQDFTPNPNQPACSTVACAIGHLPLAAPHTRIQLRESEMSPCVLLPHYTRADGQTFHHYDALAAYFEIEREQIVSLFCPDSYPHQTQLNNPVYVAQRLRDWLNQHPE